MPGTERDMSTLKLQIEALVGVLQAPSPEDQALTMRKQMGAARRERDRKMVLEVLSNGPAKAEKIGEALGLNAGGASQILRGLIKNGLVRNKGGRPATYALAAEPAVQGEPVAHTFYVLHDSAGGPKYIKKDISDGCLMIFEREEDARRAKRQHSGTDYKRVDYYTAPQPAEQHPVVAQLVEALDLMVTTHDEGGWPTATIMIARAALAAYRKGDTP